MDVLARAASPARAAGDQFAFDDALRAQREGHLSIEILRRVRHENAGAFLQRGLDFRRPNHVWEIGRADFFLTLGDKNQVDGQLAARAANRMQRGEKRKLADPSGSSRRGPSAPCRDPAFPP